MTMRERGDARPGTIAGWVGLWLVVAGVSVLWHVVTFTQLTHIDEYQHVDYLDQTLQLEHVNGGEQVEELAMREQACRGSDLEGFVMPPCDAEELAPEQFPGSGYNHTYVDPPTYYAVTAPLAKLVQGVTGVESVVTAARMVGVLWLGAGLAATFMLARRLGADSWSATGATLLLAGTPLIVMSAATVTTDAPQLVVGGALTLLVLAVTERRVPAWWLAPGGAVALAFKGTSLAVVGVLALFLLVVGLRGVRTDKSGKDESGERPGSSIVARCAAASGPVLLLLSGAAVSLMTWTVIRTATALPNVDDIPANKAFETDSIGWAELSTSVAYFLSPFSDTNTPQFTQTASLILTVGLLNLLLIAAVAGLAWLGTRGTASTLLAGCVMAGMALGGPVFTVLFFVSEGLYFRIPGRYALSLLPAAMACLAVVASRRAHGGKALTVLGVAMMTAFLLACT